MAVFNDIVTTTVTIDGKQAINQIGKLEMEVKDLNTALKSVKKNTQEYIDTNKQLQEVKDKLADARKEMGLAGMTLKQLRSYQRELNFELSNLTKGTAAYEQLKTKLQEVSKAIVNQQNDLKDTRTSWEKMKRSIKEFGVVAAGVVGGEIITGVWSAISGFVLNVNKNAAELSDQFSDIQKTTGMTAEEVKALNGELSKLDTRTASKDLRDIAKVGGQIGISKEEMLGFVESVNMATVALGDEFTGGAEEVAREVGILKNLFQETKELKAGDAISQIGSAMNALGAAGSATAPEIANFTKRIGVLGNLGPNISQTLGLGAAMQELGLSAEVSSGGLTNIFLTAGTESKAFAAQIGITEEAFKQLLNSDPNEMLMQLAKSFQGLDNNQVIAALNRMKVGSQEAIKVMSLLANQTDLVKEKQALAAEEMKKNTSLKEEATLKENNFAGQLAKTEKIINGFVASVSQSLIPVMTSLLATFVFVIDTLKALPKFLSENKQWFIALAAGIATLNGELLITNARLLLTNAQTVLVSTATKAWTTAQKLLNIVLKANPIGLIITAIGLLAAGIYTAYERAGSFTGALKGLWAMMQVLGSAFANFFSALADFDFSKMVKSFEGIGEKMLYEFDLASGKRLRDIDAANAKKAKEERDKRIEQEQAERLSALQEDRKKIEEEERKKVEAANKARAEALAKSDTKETKDRSEKLKKQQEEYDEAQRNIEALRIKAMEDGLAKRLLIIDQEAKEEIAKLKGNAQQIAEQKALILAMSEKEKRKEIFATVTKTIAEEENDIDSKKELKILEARYKLITEKEKTLLSQKQAEIMNLEEASFQEKEALLAKLNKDSKATQLQNEQDFLLARLEILKANGEAFTSEYYDIEQRLTEISVEQSKIRLDEEKAVIEAKTQMWSSFSNAFGQIQSAINQMGAEGTVFSKALAIAQIAIDTAISVSKAIAGATAAAASKGPAAPFVIAGYIATMVASVISAVSSAKKLLTTANVPTPPSAQGVQATGGYYEGGFTPRSASDRTPVGIVHANEYVIPSRLLKQPVVANMAGIIESIRLSRKGFIDGGATSNNVPALDLNATMQEMLALLRSLNNGAIKAYVIASDVRAELDNLNRLEEEARL